METKKCTSGKTYGVALAFGILKELEGAIFELMDDEAMESFKGAMAGAESNAEMKDIQDNEIMKHLSGSSLKSFLTANSKQATNMLATVLRTCDGNPIGKNYDERYTYVYEELSFKDGEEIFDFVQDHMEQVQEGVAQQEKSKPSSDPGEKKVKPEPPKKSS